MKVESLKSFVPVYDIAMLNRILFVTLAIAVISLRANACTTFLLNSGDELVFGRNYDWHIGFGLIFTNKSGVLKKAFTLDDNPAIWTSKYGSVTFNQYGREFPTGGINEAGLVVELMWLEDTQYPDEDDRASVGGILQWIQFQLDNHSTVKDVIDSEKKIRIPNSSQPVHYLVADRDGNCASIEYLNGELVSHSGNSLKYRVLANDTYERSEKYYEDFADEGMFRSSNFERSSLNRFSKACNMIEQYSATGGTDAIDYSFKILNTVAQGNLTQWSIVYDLKNMIIYFKTLASPDIRNIDVTTIDFSCGSPVKMIDINFPEPGTINSFMVNYHYRANRDLIESSYDGVDFLRGTSARVKNLAASYPERLKCKLP